MIKNITKNFNCEKSKQIIGNTWLSVMELSKEVTCNSKEKRNKEN